MSARLLLVFLLFLSACGSSRLVRAPPPEDEVARLRRDVNKVRFAIESTKELIDRSRGQPYLADLYLRLAELYVEEARYQYFIAYEGQKRRSKAVESVQARLLKEQAIAIYKRILQEFPDFTESDKVLFFIAHEHRELGDYEKMITVLTDLTERYPKSRFRNEALLVLGDYEFDRGELDAAEVLYRKVIASPESPSHGMARYKLAWVRINREDFKGALALFEAAVKGSVDPENSNTGALPGQTRRIDLRREALVDLVFPYTEVYKKPKAPLTYFRKLADSRTSYLAALAKLANRWFVKGDYVRAANVYRELLLLGGDGEDAVEWAQRLYDGVVKGRNYRKVAGDVELLVSVLARRTYDFRLGEKERKALFVEFEAYTRDLATKAQLAASRDPTLYPRAADAYERYLAFFDETKQAPAIRQNLAEARYAAKQYLEAGAAYASIMETVAKGEQRQAIYTAVAAYAEALQASAKLSRLERLQARSGLRRAGALYLERFPKEANAVQVKFHLAKSYYDEGAFETSSELFAALVEQYPQSKESTVAAELALDSLRAGEEFEELIRVGRRLASDTQLPGPLRASLMEIVTSAESRALDRATLEAGSEGDAAVGGLIAFAAEHKSSGLGEKALINAFATARNSDDLEKVAGIGDQLLREYPKSEAAPDVLATLGKMSAQAADFDRAAKYLADSASRRSDEGALDTLIAAATLQAHLGDVAGARRTYGLVLSRAPRGVVRKDAALSLAALLEQAGAFDDAAKALQTAASEEASAQTLFRLGYAQQRAGRASDAERTFRRAVAAGARGGTPADLDGAAGAQYYLSLGALANYERITLGGNRGQDAQAIQAKFAALGQVEQELVRVLELGSPRFALAALGRLAEAYAEGGRFLREAPLPAGLAGAEAEQYKAALGAKAAELEGKAKEAVATCAGKATELKVLTEIARACVAGKIPQSDPGEPLALPQRKGSPSASDTAALRKRIAKNSKDFEALGALATLYLRAGDPLGARLVLDKAAEGGADASIYNLRGVVFVAMGHPQAAHAEFERALKKDRSHARARLNLAALYRSYGYGKLADATAVKGAGKKLPAGDAGLIPGAAKELR